MAGSVDASSAMQSSNGDRSGPGQSRSRPPASSGSGVVDRHHDRDHRLQAKGRSLPCKAEPFAKRSSYRTERPTSGNRFDRHRHNGGPSCRWQRTPQNTTSNLFAMSQVDCPADDVAQPAKLADATA